MELNNNTLIIRGVTRQITRGSVTKTISDTNWDAYITPVLYPLWSSDRDKLTIFEYSNGSSETWKCDKQKYVRNHTTGQYFWKDYQFTEPTIENVRTFVTAVREAFDAAQSVETTDIEDKLNRILELEKGISLTKVKIWRDFFLHSSDWTMLEDAPVTAEEKAQWKTWREKIRDLPSQFTSANINLVQSLKVPIDPKVYKDNYLPYNDGVGYLAKDDQYLVFPEGNEDKYADMTYAMEAYIRVALTIHRPSKLFDVSSPSHITDPVEKLLKNIEERQAAVQKLKDLNS
tara:strand:+ start:675 stop:1538 length:864 start_codon:yes stop_codon:yes gene_type:complete